MTKTEGRAAAVTVLKGDPGPIGRPAGEVASSGSFVTCRMPEPSAFITHTARLPLRQLANAMRDHRATMSGSSRNLRGSGALRPEPSVALITQMAPSRWNAILAPSGDHVGSMSLELPLVNCFSPEPSALMTQMVARLPGIAAAVKCQLGAVR